VLVDGKKYEGVEGARIIIKNQLTGIEMAAKLGMTIKANSVLIPGLNDDTIVHNNTLHDKQLTHEKRF
jgi:nitrogen fixation protein NifB